MTPTHPKPDRLIYIYHMGVAGEILGPGTRLVVWTSGCPFSCRGCIEPGLRDLTAGEPWDTDSLIEQIRGLIEPLQCITFSGGEPLFQADALLDIFNSLPGDTELMLFTGYTLEDSHRLFPRQLSRVDILVAGPYLDYLSGNFLWRGSANQTITSPTHKYSETQLDTWLNSPSAGMDIHSLNDRLFFYGIPPQDLLNKLNKQLNLRGIIIHSQT